MANKGRGKTSFGVSEGLRYLDGIAGKVRVVRDAGEERVLSSWRSLEDAWSRTGILARQNVSTRCIDIPGVEVSIRVPSLDHDSSQLTCPKAPSERCGTCIVDAAFNLASFPMEELSTMFAKACTDSGDAVRQAPKLVAED